MEKQRSVAFHTLGCKLNFSETSTLSRTLESEGFLKKSFDDLADVYVINTCSVTDNADKECRQLVRRIQRKAPESLVVITGCYAQLKPKEISQIPGVNLVLGAAEKFNLATHLKELTKNDSGKISSCDIEDVSGFNASFSVNDRTRTFLKVQDGCDYTCSFCTIPMARGKSRSDTIDNVVRQASQLAKNGVKEIVLTGVNLGDFGKRNLHHTPSVGEEKMPTQNKTKKIFTALFRPWKKLKALNVTASPLLNPTCFQRRQLNLLREAKSLCRTFIFRCKAAATKF